MSVDVVPVESEDAYRLTGNDSIQPVRSETPTYIFDSRQVPLMASGSTDWGELAYETLTGNGDGPRGLLTIPLWAALTGGLGLVFGGGADLVGVLAFGGVVGFYLWGNGRLWGTKSADELVREGTEHEKNGEMDAALDCYQQAIEKDPDHPLALTGAGRQIEEIGTDQARQYLDRALENAEDLPSEIYKVAVKERGRVALAEENYAEAVEYADLALSVDSDMKEAHALKAGALNELGEDDEAEYHERRYHELEKRSEQQAATGAAETVA